MEAYVHFVAKGVPAREFKSYHITTEEQFGVSDEKEEGAVVGM